MDVAATFALYAAIINLFRGLFGKEHYNVQSVLIIAHTVLGLVFIQYILVFEQAFLSIPVLERIPAADYRDLVKAVEIVPKIVVALVILGFFHSLYEAFTIRARYLKYEKELKKFEQYK